MQQHALGQRGQPGSRPAAAPPAAVVGHQQQGPSCRLERGQEAAVHGGRPGGLLDGQCQPPASEEEGARTQCVAPLARVGCAHNQPGMGRAVGSRPEELLPTLLPSLPFGNTTPLCLPPVDVGLDQPWVICQWVKVLPQLHLPASTWGDEES